MFHHVKHRFTAVLVAAFVLTGCMTGADRGATDSKGGSGTLSSTDQQFVTMAAQGGWAEIETGQIAQKNGASDAVRQFGARMVKDHGMANKELESIASKLGMTPPKEPDAKHQAAAKKLQGLSGSEFDSQYAKHMVMDHETTVALFEKQSKGGGDPSLKAFATKQLPILQEHLKMARALPGQR